MQKKRDFYRRNRALLRMWAEYFQIKFSNTERKQEKLDIFKKGFQAGKTFNPIIEFADDLKEK